MAERAAAKIPLLVSACLLGRPCRYDGRACPLDEASLAALRARYRLIPVCPEQLGGLPTPRPPAELKDGRALTAAGEDVTAAFLRGAEACLRLAREQGARRALLKERSPSCGCAEIYDGTHSGRLVRGRGLSAARLAAAGVELYGEGGLASLLP